MSNLARTLVAGDRVAVVSPASFVPRNHVDEVLATLSSWDLVPELGVHAFDEHGFMAGTDRARLSDMNAAIRDPGVRAIVTTRGGVGAYRIADELDFDSLRADSKPVVGYSGISYLHLAVWFNTRSVGIHGCLAGETAQETTRELLMGSNPSVLHRDPQAVSAELEVKGSATGTLVGGNLPALATSVGVRLPSLEGHILFIESNRAPGIGTVERQLKQLVASGALRGIAGIALGSFEEFEPFRDRSKDGYSVADVLVDQLVPLGVPISGGLPAGHSLVEQASFPLGTMARLDTASGSMIIDAPTTTAR